MTNSHTNLQSALYAREISSITERIGEHVNAIRTILKEYFPGDDILLNANSSDADSVIGQLNEWISSTPSFRATYYAGFRAHLDGPDLDSMPKVLKQAIAAKAIGDFMAKVDSIEEIRAIAYQASQGGES